MAILQVIGSRERDLGGFAVRRVLPSAERQMVGPFIFFDHLGSTQFAPGYGIDVRPHPHIALATVTYLFSGSLEHRDSLGSVREIRPGDVNWMSAGGGIAHSERTPRAARNGRACSRHSKLGGFARRARGRRADLRPLPRIDSADARG